MVVLNFGKHKNREIEDVYKTDIAYCRWLKSQPNIVLCDSIREFLEKQFSNDDGSYMLMWGKHKNKTIKQVNQFDPKYIDWLKTTEFVKTKFPALLKELNEL